MIVSKDYSKALGSQNDKNRAAVGVTFATDTKENISTVPSEACVLELQAQDGEKWAFYDASNGGYLYAASSSKNYLRTKATLDDNGKATVAIATDGVATIKFQGTNTRNWLRYNNNRGSIWFSCYSSGQQDVYLYHNVTSAPTDPTDPTGTTDPNISYSPSTLTIAANGTLTQPTLNNPNGVTIKSYSSSNTSVANVTDKGVIALAGGTGTATITATSQADAKYKEGTATYTLTVFGAPEITPGSATMKYKKVTSMDDIVAGGVYLLVCPSRGYAMSFRYPSKTFTGAGALSFPDGEDNILSVENLNTSDGPCEITLEKVADKENVYYLRYANGGDYIYSASSDATNLGFSDKLPATQIERYEWKISFVERQISRQNTDKVTALSCLSNYSSRCLDINWSANPVRYATYKYDVNNNAPSFLYKKTFDLSVNANTAGYATAYTAFPYVMPASANGYIVTETAEGETIKAKNKYPASTEVPAYAPLLIKNSEPGVTLNPVVLGKTVEAYNYVASNEEAVAAGNVNLLYGTRLESDGVTTDVDGTDKYYYYKLSYKLDAKKNPVPDSYGFYRGKADGSAFAMQNTLTAYLALPKSGGLVNNLRISIDNEEGTTTGIQANRLPAENMPQSVYTLSGVRVNAEGNRLPKGIYIVNGKKVVIK